MTTSVTDDQVIAAREAYLSCPEGTNPMRAALEAAVRSQGKVEGWRPIVSAPMDGSQMLIWTHRLGFAVVTQDVDDPMPSSIDSLGHRFMVEDGKFGPYPIRGDYPEFWMALPAPPTEDLTAIIGEGD